MNRDTLPTDGVHFGYFAGERRRFCLPLFGMLRMLQDKYDIGPLGFEAMFRGGHWKAEHLADTIKFALIGGGMNEAEADKLVTSTISAGRLLQYAELAHAIIITTLGPVTPETEGDIKKNDEAPNDPDANSGSDPADNFPSPK